MKPLKMMSGTGVSGRLYTIPKSLTKRTGAGLRMAVSEARGSCMGSGDGSRGQRTDDQEDLLTLVCAFPERTAGE